MTRRGSVSEAILSCGRQCIALRGDNEVLNGESRDNSGNFLAARQLTTTTFAWARKGVRTSQMHMHYQVKIYLDEVVNLFATKQSQRLELGTILKD